MDIDFPVLPLRRIGFNPNVARACAEFTDLAGPLARVVEQHRSGCIVHTGDATRDAQLLPALARTTPLAVGDWVVLAPDGDPCRVVARLPAYSELQRIDPSGARQRLVTNVDVAFLVMGLDGDFNPRRLERYLALARSGGVVPVAVLTKADACADVEGRLDELAARLPPAIDRVALDARDASAVAVLQPYLAEGATGVLLGSSGAGKSTLTNTLLGTHAERTGAVRIDDSRGRHTTTARHLHPLPGGGCLIDTPGLRGLRLDVDAEALEALFEDISALAANCRFRDCTHGDEPGCAVRAGVAPDRLANYHKLGREIARERADPVARQAARAVIKARHRAARALQRDRGR